MTAGDDPETWFTLATIGDVEPTDIDNEDGCTVNAVIGFGADVTLTVVAAVRDVVVKPVPEPVAVVVMVAVPGATAVISPFAATVATAVLLEVYAYATATAAAPFWTFGVIVVFWPVTM